MEVPRYLAGPVAARSGWFAPEEPGPVALAAHVLSGGAGRWWADRPENPRALAVRCADHCLLRGDPRAFDPAHLAPLAGAYIDAPSRFLPLLGAGFLRLTPWERMVYVRSEPIPHAVVPPGVTVRRLTAGDEFLLDGMPAELSWVTDTWKRRWRLAVSGFAWGAIHDGRLVAVAGTYFLGSRHADLAVATVPEQRRRGLALACVAGLSADVAAADREASWTVGRGNTPSRRLAWSAGFRLRREVVHYFVDAAVGAPPGGGEQAHRDRAAAA